MSIVDVWIGADRALVGVDTLCSSVDGALQTEICKMVPFVHHNAIIAGRGAAMSCLMAFGAFASERLADFDELLERAPEIIVGSDKVFQRLAPGWGLPAEGPFAADGQTLVLVGWSNKTNAPKGRVFQRLHGEPLFTDWYLESAWQGFYAPWHESLVRRRA